MPSFNYIALFGAVPPLIRSDIKVTNPSEDGSGSIFSGLRANSLGTSWGSKTGDLCDTVSTGSCASNMLAKSEVPGAVGISVATTHSSISLSKHSSHSFEANTLNHCAYSNLQTWSRGYSTSLKASRAALATMRSLQLLQ